MFYVGQLDTSLKRESSFGSNIDAALQLERQQDTPLKRATVLL